MVSFQCHACGDIVKKPKLDQHHGRCHSGFDCIDCSVTFHTPAEYKSHTSCITEAEKYQKSLYKRPEKGSENVNGNTSGEGNKGGWVGGREFRGRGSGRGRGSLRGRGGYQGARRPCNEGTGANGTPLGTPQRMSPVSTPTEGAPIKFKPESKTTTTDATAPAPPLTKKADSAPCPTPNQPPIEKRHRDKKPKSKSKDSSGKVKVDESVIVRDAPPAAPLSDKTTGSTEKKKGEDANGDAGVRDGRQVATSSVVEQVAAIVLLTLDAIEKKKKEKKGHDGEDQQSQSDMAEHAPAPPSDKVASPHERKSMEIGERIAVLEQLRVDMIRDGKKDDSKKKKKKKSKVDHPVDVGAQAAVEGSKKTRREKGEGEIYVGGDTKMDIDERKKGTKLKGKKLKDEAPGTNLETVAEGKGSSKEEEHEPEKKLDRSVVSPKDVTSAKKSKKRKREDKGIENEDVAVAQIEHKSTSKSCKKDPHDSDSTPAVVEVKGSTTTLPSSGKKRKRDEKDDIKLDARDAPIPKDGKIRKRKHKKEASDGATE